MPRSTLDRLTDAIDQLPLSDQLLLLERLAQRIRTRVAPSDTGADLVAAMAADPEIRAELRQIEAEFAVTNADGLTGS